MLAKGRGEGVEMRRHGHQNRHHHQLPHSPHIVIILPVVAREINTIACSNISAPLLMRGEHVRVVRCTSWRGFVFAVVVVKITKVEFVGQHHPRLSFSCHTKRFYTGYFHPNTSPIRPFNAWFPSAIKYITSWDHPELSLGRCLETA